MLGQFEKVRAYGEFDSLRNNIIRYGLEKITDIPIVLVMAKFTNCFSPFWLFWICFRTLKTFQHQQKSDGVAFCYTFHTLCWLFGVQVVANKTTLD